jgi:hypothetical protein
VTTATEAPAIFAPRSEGPWLFGRSVDLLVFGGSALLSFALLAVGAATGLLHADAPAWVWVTCILAVDVAHVWSTAFRVYLDPVEVRRRPALYVGLPVALYVCGVILYALSSAGFWRVLAYAAVFHFVRQQYGWVALYRRRANETGRLDRILDTATIYAATLWPLLWWHGHLPRRFVWFVPNDFVAGLAAEVSTFTEPAYWALLALFLMRQVQRRTRGESINAGKVLVVVTTWACWWVGIVALDSDYAFTVTNVLIHGIPYLALTYRYGVARGRQRPESTLGHLARGGLAIFFVVIIGAAFMEETLWDKLVWHDRTWLFGGGPDLGDVALCLVVPLLALPQATHYALDGFIWKVRREKNPKLAEELG